jgi:hypothetical protein
MTNPDEAPRIRPAFRVLGLIIGPAIMAGMALIVYGCRTGAFHPDGVVVQDCELHRAYAYFLAGLVITYAAAVGRDPLARLRARPVSPRSPDSHS